MSIYDRFATGELEHKKPWCPKLTNPSGWEEWKQEGRELKEKLKQACIEEFSDKVWPSAVNDRLFAQAWDYGHSAGFYEVCLEFEELATFAKDLLAAGLC